jgi:hypothetical protein
MAKKPTIVNVASGFQSTTTINNNFENVKNAFDNTLSLDGSTPNAMQADIDMNSNDIINVNSLSTHELIVDNLNLSTVVAETAALVDQFDDRYLGAKATNPTVDNDGNALQVGAIFFHTGENKWKAWGGSAWYPSDTMGATSATLVTFSPTGAIASSNVQTAIVEVVSDLATTTGAATVGSTATGYVTNTTVQGAINQIVSTTPTNPWESIKIRMRLGRVDFVGIGDSNQIFGGNGWDHGIQYALSQQFSMWATGLVSQNENNGDGAAQGYGYNRFGPLVGAVSGAPADLNKFLNKGSGALFPAFYTYVADGSSISNSFGCGLILGANCIIDNGAALSFDIHYGTFTTGTGSFRASVRLEEPPYSLIVENAIKSTNTGAYGMAVETVSLTADGTRASKAISLKPISTNVTGITGPYFNTYYRARNPSRTAGWSYGTLDYRGGQSLRTMAYDVQQATDDTLTHYFSKLRNDQGSTIKTIVVCVNSGLNDRNETLASVGTGAVTPGDSAAAFVDNYKALRDRVIAIWTANSWDQNELFWLVYVSHPITTPDDSELISYRTAIFNYARGLPRTQVVSMTDLTTSTEMTANSWYASVGDTSHLSIAGYEQLGTRIVDKLQ